jgi:hypothetical protein
MELFHTTEFLFISTTLVSMGVVLFAYKLGKVYVIALTAVALILANVIGPKIVSVFGFAITAGTPIFAVLPLATDLLTERYGKKVAKSAVYSAFLGMLLFILVSQLIIAMEWLSFSETTGRAVDTILGSSLRLMVASPVAYVVWQMVDIGLYLWIKEITGEKYLWLRNNVSTFVAQTGSTYMFFGLAFTGTGNPWIEIATVTVVFYWIIAIIDTPFAYLSRRIKPLELSA